MLKYFKHLSIRLFFILLGILLLLTAWSLVYAKQHVLFLLTAGLLVLGALAWWLARSISRIRRTTQKQKQLITRLLELARLENRDSLNDTQTVDLANLAAQAAQESRAALQAKQLHIALNCPPQTVQGDPLLLRQAIDNLLYNAIDFAETGSEIRLSLTRSRNRTELAVYNQGSPIPDYALAKSPQRFYSLPRADGSRSSGLGLSFTTEIMRLHHGRLMLANRENGVEALLLFEGEGEEAV